MKKIKKTPWSFFFVHFLWKFCPNEGVLRKGSVKVEKALERVWKREVLDGFHHQSVHSLSRGKNDRRGRVWFCGGTARSGEECRTGSGTLAYGAAPIDRRRRRGRGRLSSGIGMVRSAADGFCDGAVERVERAAQGLHFLGYRVHVGEDAGARVIAEVHLRGRSGGVTRAHFVQAKKPNSTESILKSAWLLTKHTKQYEKTNFPKKQKKNSKKFQN